MAGAFRRLSNNLLAATLGLAVLLCATALATTAVDRDDEDIPWLAISPGLLTRA